MFNVSSRVSNIDIINGQIGGGHEGSPFDVGPCIVHVLSKVWITSHRCACGLMRSHSSSARCGKHWVHPTDRIRKFQDIFEVGTEVADLPAVEHDDEDLASPHCVLVSILSRVIVS